MKGKASYRVQLRRRREGKTDYQARKAMVVSTRPRLVTRPSLKNMYAQIIAAKIDGDKTLAAASTPEIVKKYGWKAPTGNIPAAYLTGLLVGLKAKAAGIDAAILDLGLINPTKGARVFAVLYGVLDAGVEVPHGEEKIVKERAKGDHIAQYAKALSSEDQEAYQEKFSKYTKAGVAPENVAKHFSEVRMAMVGSFKGAKVAPEPPSAPEQKAKPKPQAPKPEGKAAPAPAPKTEAKPAAAPTPAPTPKAAPAPKAEVPVAPKPEAKPAAKAEEKATPKAEAKVEPKAKTAKEKAPAAEEAPKEKAPKAKPKAVKEEETPKEKAAKGKTPKTEKASEKKSPAKEKAPAKKATKKGEKKA